MARDTLFQKSENIYFLKRNKYFLVWHSLFNNIIELNEDAFQILCFFQKPKTVKEFLSYFESDELLNIFNFFKKNYFINPVNFDDRVFIKRKILKKIEKKLDGSGIHYLELRVSEMCNFNCSYCIMNNAQRLKNKNYKKIMEFDVAKKAVDVFLNLILKNGRKIAEITLGGGEPILNWALIEKIVKYSYDNYPNVIFKFYLNTNFSLINKDMVKFIKKYNLQVSPSIDGYLKEKNDNVRVFKNGSGTYDLIMKKIEMLKEAGVVIDSCSMTMNEKNIDFLNKDLIQYFIDQQFKYVTLNFDVMNFVKTKINYTKFFNLICLAEKNNIDISGFWRRIPENISYSGKNINVSFCGALKGTNLCVDPEGDIYSCGYSNQKIGNIFNFESFFKQNGKYHSFLKQNNSILKDLCNGCMFESSCGGGCLISREFEEQEGDSYSIKVKQMCELYQRMAMNLLGQMFKKGGEK